MYASPERAIICNAVFFNSKAIFACSALLRAAPWYARMRERAKMRGKLAASIRITHEIKTKAY
jgi:hypothetical protein